MKPKTNFKKIARTLRKNPTDTEKLLWKHLQRKQLCELKFRRQHPVGNYIVDFICLEKKLIVELDGGQHALEHEKDKVRDEWLRSEGYKVLRFWNIDVIKNLEGVLETILNVA